MLADFTTKIVIIKTKKTNATNVGGKVIGLMINIPLPNIEPN
jgi:hypothetical protein